MQNILKLIILVLFTSTAKAQVFGGEKDDTGISFCEINNSYFLTGITRSYGNGSDDIWILKVNSAYEVVDEFVVGTWESYDVPSEIIATSDDELVVLGYSWNAPGPGNRGDIVIAKYDTVGNQIWSSYFGGKKNDYSGGLIETKDKGFVITGINRAEGSRGAAYLIKVNKDGVKEWEHFYDEPYKDMGMDVVQCEDSGFIMIANINTFKDKSANSSEYLSADASKIMLIKTDVNGNEVWRKFYGGDKFDFGKRIVTNGKDFFFTGSSMNNSNGSFDVVLYKINSNGDVIYSKNYGGKGYEYGNSITINNEEEILLTGYSNSYSVDSVPDVYLIKTDSIGDVIWEKTYGEAYSEYGEKALFLSGLGNEIGIVGSAVIDKGGNLIKDFYFIKVDKDGDELLGISTSTDTPQTPSNKFIGLVYPNPARDQFFVKYSGGSLDNVNFKLFNITGHLITESILDRSPYLVNLESRLSAGVYLYQIQSGTSIVKGRIILNY